jgi:hypothetical protein
MYSNTLDLETIAEQYCTFLLTMLILMVILFANDFNFLQLARAGEDGENDIRRRLTTTTTKKEESVLHKETTTKGRTFKERNCKTSCS